MEKEEIFKIYKDTRSNDGNLCRGALWEVSNCGNVRKNGDDYIQYEMKNGYLAFGTVYYVHRAVAELFIPNPENKPTVDHINRDKHDNRVCNLRWATMKEQSANRDIDAISKANLGNKFKLGYNPSEETRAKLRAVHLGKVWVFNPTTEQSNLVNPSQLNDYLAKGYIRGRKTKK